MSPSKKIVSTHLYRISFRMDQGHLRAGVSGYGGSLDSTVAYWKAIADEVREVRPRSLLVVDQMEGGPMPPEQVPQFIEALSGRGFRGLRIAYVEGHVDQLSQAEVAEILACEKGYNVRVFSNEMNAAVWLRHGEL